MTEEPGARVAASDCVALQLAGEYDISRRDELERHLSRAYGARVAVLDVKDVSYLDSTALTCLIRLRKRIMEHDDGGVVRIVGAGAQVRRILNLTNLERLFELAD